MILTEMMLGLRDRFEYFQCANCGCIQICDIPDNLSVYYPDGYYSFAPAKLSWKGRLRNKLTRLLINLRYSSVAPLYTLIARLYSPDIVDWITIPRLKFTDRILDVGCGAGHLLVNFAAIGFKNLLGIDPFLAHDTDLDDGVIMRKFALSELNEQFDFVMLHHSLEHMPDQHDVMVNLSRVLTSTGKVIIRIPIASEAYEKYGPNWVQLDAPRHLYTHTERSFRLLVDKHGFSVDRVVYDSTEFQFWASEQYAKGVSLQAPESQLHRMHSADFKRSMRKRYRKLVLELNRTGRGDQACFYLRKK